MVQQVWDLMAGRLMHEFTEHTAAITGLEFHPSEFLLAAASADHTMALLDLDPLGLIDTLGPDPAGTHAFLHTPSFHSLCKSARESA